MNKRVRLIQIPRLRDYTADVFQNQNMQSLRSTPHHKTTSTYAHSVSVAETSLQIAKRLRIPVDPSSLIRGALLHDFYLYNLEDERERFVRHLFTHADHALLNARHAFTLNEIEQDIIKKHMLPLTPAWPGYRESFIVSLADKICAVREYLRPEPAAAQEAFADMIR